MKLKVKLKLNFSCDVKQRSRNSSMKFFRAKYLNFNLNFKEQFQEILLGEELEEGTVPKNSLGGRT